MSAALLDCHCRRPGGCRCCGWQPAEPAPCLPRGMARGDPALSGAGRGTESNAGRAQESHTHTHACTPTHGEAAAPQRVALLPAAAGAPLPGAFTRAKCSFGHSRQGALLPQHPVSLHTPARCAGILWQNSGPAGSGGRGRSRARRVGSGKRRRLILFHCLFCFAGRDRGKDSDSLANE